MNAEGAANKAVELAEEALAQAKALAGEAAVAMEEDFRNRDLEAKYRRAVLHVETLEHVVEEVKRLKTNSNQAEEGY